MAIDISKIISDVTAGSDSAPVAAVKSCQSAKVKSGSSSAEF